MKKNILFYLILLFCINTSIAQIGPCSINPGSQINLCTSELSFTLDGVVGTNVNNLEWTTNDPNIFDIVNPSSPTSVVNIMINPTPLGCYIFTLSGDCIVNGTLSTISQDLEVCIYPEVTQAEITVEGESLDYVVACTKISLSGISNLPNGEIGCWSDNTNDPNLTIENDECGSDLITLTLRSSYTFPCRTYEFYYTISNNGCTTADTIVVEFRGQNEDIAITFPSNGEVICDDQFNLEGTNIGCENSDFEFVHLNPQDFTIQPTYGSKTTGFFMSVQFVTFYESGWYTFQFNVESSDNVCDDGSDTTTFFVCVTDQSQHLGNILEVFCDGLPDTYSFSNPINSNWTYSDWTTTDSDVNIEQVGDQVFIANIDTEGKFLKITQDILTNECVDGQITHNCGYTRTIILRIGPDIELNSDNLTNSCGGILNFRPWRHVDVIQPGTPQLVVLEVPDGETIIEAGDSFGGTQISFDLEAIGKYTFRFYEESEFCTDSLDLCVTICDSGQPNAPEVSFLCVGDNVVLAGQNPEDECATILWTQISGPEITFVNGTSEFDQFPEISVDEPGNVCIEFSYSREEDCYLADTTCFDVIPCEDPCYLTANVDIGLCSDNGTPTFVSDDYFTAFIDIANTNGMSWSMKQLFPNGDMETIFSGQGDNSVDYNFNIQEGDFTLIICIDDLEDCQVAIPIEVPDQCSGCLNVTINNVSCYDNGTGTPEDDYWSFDVTVEGGSGDWFISSPINASGTTGITTTINMGLIINSNTIEFYVVDPNNRDCFVRVSVDPPSTCSEECPLSVYSFEPKCIEIDDQSFYTIDIFASVLFTECFNVIRRNADGSEESFGIFFGSQTVSLGPFSPMEKFTLVVKLCKTDCERELLICPPEDCDNCLDYVVSNVMCYDNGTSDPDDDYWTFDVLANGPSQGWSSGAPFYVGGVYGQPTTINAGLISLNPSVSFEISDFWDFDCNAKITVDAPPSCSEECELEVFHKVSHCRYEEQGQVFYVKLGIDLPGDDCVRVIKIDTDGTEEVLGTFYGTTTERIGPFGGQDAFTLIIESCDGEGCSRELYIEGPCGDEKSEKSNSRDQLSYKLLISPNPASGIIKIENESKGADLFSIFSMEGRIMIEGEFRNGLVEINVEKFENGIYILKSIDQDGMSLSKKFLVIK